MHLKISLGKVSEQLGLRTFKKALMPSIAEDTHRNMIWSFIQDWERLSIFDGFNVI